MSDAQKNTCQVASACGGCCYTNMSYEQTLQKKQELVNRLLEKLCPVMPIIGASDPFYYRNKVHAAFGKINSKTIVCGTYAEGSHKIIESDPCYIEDKKAAAIIKTIKALAISFKTPIYDERSGQGVLRRVLVRVAKVTGEIMVVLVVADPVFPGKKAFIRALLDKHPEITTVIMNVNSKRGSMILGEKSITQFGKGFIIEKICSKSFKLSAESFCQINHEQMEKLYMQAIEYAELTGEEAILDAYCGIGTIGLIAASKAKKLLGIEINGKAVFDAVANAKYNDLGNCDFRKGDATDRMHWLAEKGEHFDVLFLDPPRAGTTPEFINACKLLAPSRVVYISCDPETLARDLKLFANKGYVAQKAQPVDMFPWTGHVETVCLLSKLNVNEHIYVDLEMSELDITSAEKKASYEQIKSYVLEHTGLKVSHLNIAQIKRKHGIIERDCYNLPKSENSRQPNCTVEKEKAIVDALKYFKMI